MEKVPCQFVAGRGLLMRVLKDAHVLGRRGLDAKEIIERLFPRHLFLWPR